MDTCPSGHQVEITYNDQRATVAEVCINHLSVALAGHASIAVWVGTALPFVVPFCMANLGVQIGSHQEHHGQADGSVAPTWSRLSTCPRCVVYGPHLKRTVTIALIVGTMYFVVNQLAVAPDGQATVRVWIETGVTYLVPFTVSNIGLLVGRHQTAAPDPGTDTAGVS